MDVQTVNVAAQEAQPPPGGRAMSKGVPLMGGSSESQAAFQSLMASLMAPLLAAQAPQMMATQPATGEAQAALVSNAALAAYGGQPTAALGQGMAAQVTVGQQAQVTEPTTDLLSMMRGTAATPVTGDANPAATVQATTQQPVAVDNTATLDALRSLAAGQSVAATTAEGVTAASTQTSSAATLTAQLAGSEAGEQTEKQATVKPESGSAPTPFASAFTATVNTAESVKGAGDVKPANASPVQQIADQVQMTLNRGENSATIRLQPAELGGVRIRMQVQDGQLHLSIEAEKSGTSQLIDQQLGTLRQSLESSGMRIGDLAILAGGRGQTGGVEAMQREAVQSMRTMQMEMGSQQFQQQQQHAQQQQAAFAGQDGQQRQRGQFDPAQVLEGSRPSALGAVHGAGMGSRNVWQAAAYAAVDYYA